MRVDTIAVAAGEMLYIISDTRRTGTGDARRYTYDAPVRIEAANALAKLQKFMLADVPRIPRDAEVES